MVIELNKDNFEQEVLKAEGTVIVDFWAPWCGPCRVMGPILEEASEMGADAKFCKLNVDNSNQISTRFNVMSIPTLIVFKNGEAVKSSVGVVSKQEIIDMLK